MPPPIHIILFVIVSSIFVVITSFAWIALTWHAISAIAKRKPLPFIATLIAVAIVIGILVATCLLTIFSHWWMIGAVLQGEPEYVLMFLFIASLVGVLVWIAWINVWWSNRHD
jgi:hypothetical protein